MLVSTATYLVFPLNDAHFDIILRRVPDQPSLFRQVCQAEVVHHISGTNNIHIRHEDLQNITYIVLQYGGIITYTELNISLCAGIDTAARSAE